MRTVLETLVGRLGKFWKFHSEVSDLEEFTETWRTETRRGKSVPFSSDREAGTRCISGF